MATSDSNVFQKKNSRKNKQFHNSMDPPCCTSTLGTFHCINEHALEFFVAEECLKKSKGWTLGGNRFKSFSKAHL